MFNQLCCQRWEKNLIRNPISVNTNENNYQIIYNSYCSTLSPLTVWFTLSIFTDVLTCNWPLKVPTVLLRDMGRRQRRPYKTITKKSTNYGAIGAPAAPTLDGQWLAVWWLRLLHPDVFELKWIVYLMSLWWEYKPGDELHEWIPL